MRKPCLRLVFRYVCFDSGTPGFLKQQGWSMAPALQTGGSVLPAQQQGWSMAPALQTGGSVLPAQQQGWSMAPALQTGGSVFPAQQQGWSMAPALQTGGSVFPAQQQGWSMAPALQKWRIYSPSILSSSASLRTGTPSLRALSSFDPAFSPATT